MRFSTNISNLDIDSRPGKGVHSIGNLNLDSEFGAQITPYFLIELDGGLNKRNEIEGSKFTFPF